MKKIVFSLSLGWLGLGTSFAQETMLQRLTAPSRADAPPSSAAPSYTLPPAELSVAPAIPRPESAKPKRMWVVPHRKPLPLHQETQPLAAIPLKPISFSVADERNPIPEELGDGDEETDLPIVDATRTPEAQLTATLRRAGRSVVMLPNNQSRKTMCSCVLFARTLVASLPMGLFDYNDKLRIINSRTPELGAVAIMWSRSGLGHVAVVKSINDDGTLTIEEGNFRRCKRNIRTDTPANMNIKGYFDPNI